MMKTLILAALAATTLATPAMAVVSNTYTTSGSLTLTDPTFNRPLNDGTGLSSVGSAVHYDTLSFTVSATGNYNFLLNSGGSFDTYLALYSPSFKPLAGLTNLVAFNDDLATIAAGSGFNQSLTAGTSYIAVLTAFENAGVGNYTFVIDGPGVVTPSAATAAVPEPATWAMMTLGFGAVGFAMRRKKVATRIRFA